MSTNLAIPSSPTYLYSPRNSMSSTYSSSSSQRSGTAGGTPSRRTSQPTSFFESSSFLQPVPRDLQGSSRDPTDQLDKLERLAEEVQQLQKQQVLHAMAGHGYSSMISGLYASHAMPQSPSRTTFPGTINTSAAAPLRRLGSSNMPALPDSPRVDQFAV